MNTIREDVKEVLLDAHKVFLEELSTTVKTSISQGKTSFEVTCCSEVELKLLQAYIGDFGTVTLWSPSGLAWPRTYFVRLNTDLFRL